VPSHTLEIIPCNRERLLFENINELVSEIREHGYYGGTRLIKAAIHVLYRYCKANHLPLHKQNFTISYSSDIPSRLGLAGSSAIVIAALKALIQFYEIKIPNAEIANIALAAEKQELHIGAGLQDRVVQAYNTPVFMDFSKHLMDAQGHGEYITFDKDLLPSLYIAYQNNLSEGSELTHNNLAERYAKQEPEVLQAISEWRKLTEEVWDKLQKGDKNIGHLLNRNYDLRSALIPISKGNKKLIDTARTAGASAKFTGSGGAIIGTYDNAETFERLTKAMRMIDAVVIKPKII
jgi:glucuronokinase